MAVFRQDKPRDEPPCYTRFYALHMGNCPYQLSGKRHAPSFLQGTRPRFASGTLMSRSDDTAFPRWGTVRVRPRFPNMCFG